MRTTVEKMLQKKDIEYRGPLSYVHLRIIAWICMFIEEISFIIFYADSDVQIFETVASDTFNIPRILNYFGTFGNGATSCFVIASFAVILQEKEGYKKLLKIYAGLAGSIVAVFYLGYILDNTGVISMFGSSLQNGMNRVWEYTEGLGFNLFIDVFLYSLAWFFVNYIPKNSFKGKKLIIFRCFAVFPILYEIVFLVLKALKFSYTITIPKLLYPFIPTNTVFQTIIFVFLLLYIKNREAKFTKHGKTVEEYNKYLKTNANSLHFSILCAAGFFIAGILGFIISGLLNIVSSGNLFYVTCFFPVIGVTQASANLTMVPLILLFSYTKKPKKDIYDITITLGGLGILVVLYLIEFIVK